MSSPALDPAARQKRLAKGVRRLRSRREGGSGGGNLDRWLLLLGGVLIPLGFLLVTLGWIGASGTPLLFEQIPYMISGGLFGLGLVFAGGFVYFAYWLTLLVRESRTAREDLQASLSRLEELLAATLTGGAAMAATSADGHAAVVATATGSMVHRPDCAAVVGRPNLRPASLDEPGLTACGLCQPLATVNS
ncbi:MAG: hypothetical protein ABIO67_06420 [Mycobacteriales bacterium]